MCTCTADVHVLLMCMHCCCTCTADVYVRTAAAGFIGNWDFALSATGSGGPPNNWQLFLWDWVFCAASTTILSGAVAERATLLS